MSADCSDTFLALPEDGGNEPLPESLTRYTGFLVAKAHQRLWAMFGAECRKLGIESPCVGVLHLLAEFGPMSQQQLGRKLRVDRTTMVKLIDHLEGLKLARRCDNPADRRAYLVENTPHGEKTLALLKNAGEAMERKLLAQFTEAERVLIRRALLTLAG
jgi:MarR family transcriptional regulator, lower aerobic nicotinate degradation pathway regulator